jgi:hypothetical protein
LSKIVFHHSISKKEKQMRMLSKVECKAIGGAGTSVAAFSSTNNGANSNEMSTTINGVTTVLQCSTPLKLGFTLGVTSVGKFLNLDTGFTVSMPANCTTTITDSLNHTVVKCVAGASTCTWLNLKTGDTKQVAVDPTDSGLEQLAQIQGEDLSTLFAGGDWTSPSLNESSGGGLSGGGDGGGDGGGGGGGSNPGGDGDDDPKAEA